MSSELSRIELLRAALAATSPAVLVGIGDDAAILAPCAEPLVWTIDAAVDGVHFRRDLLDLEDVGYRSTMAAASDLAAMGADAIALVAALILPAEMTDDELTTLVRGQRTAADELGAPVVGGNLARGSELSITTSAIGRTARPLTRSGAKPGDVLWLGGPVGLAAAGFRLLDRRLPATSRAALASTLAWRRPTARIEAGRRARDVATAAIDISDGLAQDLGHIARSSGVRVVLDPGALVSPTLRDVAGELGVDPLDLALHGGEDYALLVAAPSGVDLEGFIKIGLFEALNGLHAPVALRSNDGSLRAVEERGYDHFTKPPA